MTEDATFYVYLMSRLDGRPCYVGKGKGERWRHHGKCGRNRHLISIIKQARAQGQELPRVKVLEGITEEHAFRVEKALIAFFGREDLGTGLLVNLTDGGDGTSGYRPSAELIERQAATRRGRPQSPESNAKRSAALRGRKKSPEHIVAAAAGQCGSKRLSGWWSTEEGRAKQRQNDHSRLGQPHTPETIEKIKTARANQTNVAGFKSGHQPSIETRSKMSASATAAWAKRRASYPSQGELL